MSRMLFSVARLLTFAVVISDGYQLPPYFKVCQQSIFRYNDCVREGIEHIIPYIVKGLKEYKTVPLSPLYLPRVEAAATGGLVDFDILLTNLTYDGLENMKLIYSSINPADRRFILNIYFPYFHMNSNYKLNGSFLFLELAGDGPLTIRNNHLTFDVGITGDLVEREGEKYLNVTEVEVDFDEQPEYVYFGNLFGGRGEEEEANAFINRHIVTFWSEFKWICAEVFRSVARDTAIRVFSKIPYEALFPE